MEVLILAPQWGFEHLPAEEFIIKIKDAGFDGIDTWMPEDEQERKEFVKLIEQYKLPIVSHQHQAKGNNINEFCRSFEYYLNISMECNPILINSHSGRDYFSLDDQLRVIDVAEEFSVKNNIRVVHETHRGRLGYSPYNAAELFKHRPGMKITADLSHWVCVTESYLEHCPDIVNEALNRAEHMHARVGHTQGPQVPDPRVVEWQQATDIFMNWWERVIDIKRQAGYKTFTITTEFGPPPYMVKLPGTGEPIANQFDINCFMKDIIRNTIV
ncbi:sugar phosphate isomerase/epimerase family protein [Mucilaginibacter pedocola]|uniref:Xylose isomerase-like TIM barrel domain-containing protein n=1 Tax=Mucilaginibacter pedocola TaxID=1792845 RepID=A0A1S9P730_9SPHI|nr:TIM barrel protein [Mucilaginibacter pedocola]OOQ56761.1 hypothetical protein BC343_17380 [Mucilaginibacter pedocola]